MAAVQALVSDVQGSFANVIASFLIFFNLHFCNLGSHFCDRLQVWFTDAQVEWNMEWDGGKSSLSIAKNTEA